MKDVEQVFKIIGHEIAKLAHEGQFRRDGVTPYIVHPEQVADRLVGHDLKNVGYMHDVLEDCPQINREDLIKLGVAEHIVVAVEAMTKQKGEEYFDYLKRVKDNVLAREVKIIDMLCNLGDAPSEKQIEKYSKGLMFLAVD